MPCQDKEEHEWNDIEEFSDVDNVRHVRQVDVSSACNNTRSELVKKSSPLQPSSNVCGIENPIMIEDSDTEKNDAENSSSDNNDTLQTSGGSSPLSEGHERKAAITKCESPSHTQRISNRINSSGSTEVQQKCRQLDDGLSMAAASETISPRTSPQSIAQHSLSNKELPCSQPSPKHLCFDDQWEVKRIVGKRRGENGWEYKIVWKSTWHPKTDLSCSKLIKEFQQRVASKEPYREEKTRRAGRNKRKGFAIQNCDATGENKRKRRRIHEEL